jgi:hypothetical protein
MRDVRRGNDGAEWIAWARSVGHIEGECTEREPEMPLRVGVHLSLGAPAYIHNTHIRRAFTRKWIVLGGVMLFALARRWFALAAGGTLFALGREGPPDRFLLFLSLLLSSLLLFPLLLTPKHHIPRASLHSHRPAASHPIPNPRGRPGLLCPYVRPPLCASLALALPCRPRRHSRSRVPLVSSNLIWTDRTFDPTCRRPRRPESSTSLPKCPTIRILPPPSRLPPPNLHSPHITMALKRINKELTDLGRYVLFSFSPPRPPRGGAAVAKRGPLQSHQHLHRRRGRGRGSRMCC